MTWRASESVVASEASIGSAFVLLVAVLSSCAGAGLAPRSSTPVPQGSYEVWVASEAVDEITRIRFDGRAAEVVQRRSVGSIPVEVEGPHGVAASPDGRFVYVTLGHGLPYGTLLKIELETDRVVGRTTLGLFPATIAVTPDGEYAFVSNFNLHGDHVPSSVSMVHLPSMTEVGRTETCVMPHGSRVDPTGARHYSVCMMDELLVELDASTGELLRSFSLSRNMEGPAAHHGRPEHAHPVGPAGDACSPTWAEPGFDGSRIYVACSRAAEIVEIDVERWELTRRFQTGESPYNIAVTTDGRLMLVTLRNRTDPALEIHDLSSGRRVGRVPVSTTLAHGVAVSDDSRFAFVSVEGVGAEPGRVDIVDIEGRRLVTSVEVGQQATGIAIVPAVR